MNVSLKTFMPVVAAGLLGLNACSHVEERAKDYMQDKAYSEFVELTNTSNTTLIQSRLDSLAYRDIFNGTKLANDSASVAEFNKIAACLRGYNNEYDCSQRIVAIEKGLKDQGILTKDFSIVKDLSATFAETLVQANKLQHYADDWAYRKFFTQKRIMTDELSKQCDEVSKKIRP